MGTSPLSILWWPIVPCVLAAALAVYFLLPRPRPFPAWLGGGLGGLALVLAGVLLVRTGVSVEAVLFYLFAGIAVISGTLLVTQSNPARAALAFALVVLSTCGLFLLQAAPFLMAATTIIYAGAIIVTFLFVLMLAQQEHQSDADNRSREPVLACAAGFALLATLLFVLFQTYWNPTTTRVFDRLNAVLARAAEATAQRTPKEVNDALNGDQFFEELEKIVAEAPSDLGLARFEKAVKDQEESWFEAKHAGDEPARFLQKAVADLRRELHRAYVTRGDLAPERTETLSTFSGPPPNVAIDYDVHGNAPLPAENTVMLGKSLFTDYLLAVELGGTLLLVATIGAIAIASRREDRP